jgi:hypothetical protein
MLLCVDRDIQIAKCMMRAVVSFAHLKHSTCDLLMFVHGAAKVFSTAINKAQIVRTSGFETSRAVEGQGSSEHAQLLTLGSPRYAVYGAVPGFARRTGKAGGGLGNLKVKRLFHVGGRHVIL